MKKHTKIEAIIFDLGGVVVESDFEFKFYRFASKKFKIPDDSLHLIVQKEWNSLERGEETNKQFWCRIARKLNLNNEVGNELAKLWIDFYKKSAHVKYDTVDLIKKLYKNYKLGVISNTQSEHIAVHKKEKILKYFKSIILSYEVGMRKSEKSIFILASRQLDTVPENCLFIDDRMPYIKVARKYGFKAILFKSASDLERSLAKVGIRFG